ncbi:MAG: mechanosensitive ion channel [Chthoniobacterales bacterium]|nr:mechanosensitive ion channel [Chthoniobacterales bacterium]
MPCIRRTFRALQIAGLLVSVFEIFCPLPASAQGIKAMIEVLGGGSKVATPELSPAGQLDWAKAQIVAAKEDEKRESAIISRLADAGLPATRIEDFRAANREIQRNFQGAADILSLMAVEGAGQEKPQEVAPPGSEQEAAILRDSLRSASLAVGALAGEEDLIRRFVVQNQTLLTSAEREARQFQEEFDLAKTPEARVRAEIELELADRQRRAADSAVFLGKWKSAEQEMLARKLSAEVEALRAALRTGGFERQVDSRRANSQLAVIEAENAAAEKDLAAAIKDQARLAAEAATLREGGDSPLSKNRAAAAGLLADTAQRLVTVLQARVYLLADEKAHWSAVKTLADEGTPEALKTARDQSEEIIAKHKNLRPSVDRRLLEAREALESAEKQLRGAAQDATTRSLLDQNVALARKRTDILGTLASKSGQIVTTQEEFLGEVQAVLGGESFSRRMTRTWDEMSRMVSYVWSWELFGNESLRITIGKVILGVLGLLAALGAANWLARSTSRAATRRFQLAEEQKALLEKSVFFPVVSLLVLLVLYWLNIPLTVFAFLGGALAIGIGFGAQNLMNNFISGILLLLERQIKVGDIIEVVGSTGKVVHLGSRCSRIQKFDGVELLVPNSAFLEKEVTNWTLADPRHRFDFTLGVAYGSPVEKTLSLLTSAVERQPEILRDPAPGVFFEAFGESALVFRIYYWLELGEGVDARQVGSDLRCRIERDLRTAGIEMPFPQRDVHFKSFEPIPVRVEMAEPTSSREEQTRQ